MSWKKNRLLFKERYPDESQFIIGLDIGNSMSSIAYFDVFTKEPSIIDISGGYGKQNIPSVVQYVKEGKEWVFGEYALLNSNNKEDIKITSLIERLGKKEYFYINNKPYSHSTILGMYIKELINNCKSLNPKANIAGIVVSIPSYISEEALEELKLAFKYAGYEKYVIRYVPDRECILARYYFNKEVLNERILIIDYGSKELRVGIYDVANDSGNIEIDCISSMFLSELGEENIDDILLKLVLSHLNKPLDEFTDYEREQLFTFIYNNKDLIFQKNLYNKHIKLYYNFVHPPFQHTLTFDELSKAMSDYIIKFQNFIKEVFDKSIVDDNKKLSFDDIDKVICTGGGFEMFWAKRLCKSIFGKDKTVFYKNSKGMTAEGAAIISASNLGLLENRVFNIKDKNILEQDIGLKIFQNNQEKFYTVIEKNSFWWNINNSLAIILNDVDYRLNIYKRNSKFEESILDTLYFKNLSKRPKGTAKIKLNFYFTELNTLCIEVEDLGFGEIFPKTEYKEKFIISI